MLTRLLNIEHPIIQGPMGGGYSTVELAATVSNHGGLGSFGAHQLDGPQIEQLVADLRERTQKPFNINLWVRNNDGDPTAEDFAHNCERLKPYFDELGIPLPAYPEAFGRRFEDQVEAVLRARPPVFSFVFGIPPTEILRECRHRNIVTLGTATTPAEAQALEEAGVDAIVASGFEAGGHRGSFLAPARDSLMGTFSLVPQVVGRVRVPVIAAGGIADGRTTAAALVLGAQGVQVGTAFLATRESGTTDRHRELLFSEAAHTTTLTRAFSGRLARGLVNRFVRENPDREDQFPGYPAQSWFTAQLRAAAQSQGKDDLTSMWSSQSASLLRHRSAVEVFQSLLPGVAART